MSFVTAVTDVQDAAGDSLVLANPDGTRPALALKLGTGLSGTYSKDGDVGVVEVTPTGASAPLSGSSLTLGQQTPPQYVASVGATQTISTGTQMGVLLIPVPVGHKVQAEFSIQAFIALPTPGILLPASATIIVDAASYGTSGPIVIAETVDATRSTNASPWIDNTFAVSVSGSNLSINIAAVTPVPFQSGHAYTGGYAGGTTPPNAVGDGSNSLVTNDSGKIYVCVAGGTDSGSGGPTGTSAGDITVGGLTWRYVAPSGSHLTLTYTVCLDGVKTG